MLMIKGCDRLQWTSVATECHHDTRGPGSSRIHQADRCFIERVIIISWGCGLELLGHFGCEAKRGSMWFVSMLPSGGRLVGTTGDRRALEPSQAFEQLGNLGL